MLFGLFLEELDVLFRVITQENLSKARLEMQLWPLDPFFLSDARTKARQVVILRLLRVQASYRRHYTKWIVNDENDV